MAKQLFANNAVSTLSGVLTQGGTTLVCSGGHGSRFPTPSNGDYFLMTIYTKDTYATEQQVEVVKVIDRSGDVMTIERDTELLTGQAGGFAYNGSTTTVYLELRWTALGASNSLQAGDNLASIADASVARSNLGLGNVDNTSDANKPVSTAQATAIADKLDTSHAGTGGTAHANVVASGAAGFMTGTDKAKLDGIAAGATDYTHPANHAPSIITQDASNRFVTDAEKATWNAKGDVTLTGVQVLTNKTLTGYTESVYSLAGTDLNPANGSIQYKTLAGNTTFTESLANGQSVVLMLNPGTYTVTWPTATWIGSGASSAPTLAASVYNCITFFQFNGTLYGKYEGRV